ncbi:hypothetical protein J3458_022572 [Metarhizium acridum]|uniref:uncharacterized protein n=1 Tax=Metarhizium acridum TaxID=92637 RepID=UPI001C6D035C|nr:hypothetical protein J3458_022572 [Metarhizium acridum]
MDTASWSSLLPGTNGTRFPVQLASLPQSNPSLIPLTIVDEYHAKMRATTVFVTIFVSLCLAHPLADASGDKCPPMGVSTAGLWVLFETVKCRAF